MKTEFRKLFAKDLKKIKDMEEEFYKIQNFVCRGVPWNTCTPKNYEPN